MKDYYKIIKKYKGRRFYKKEIYQIEVKNTAYGILIENFEDNKFDIQLTIVGIDNLNEFLNNISKKTIDNIK